jgi:hypothetical protein
METTKWTPQYSPWRHGGWYVNNVHYPNGAIGCVSRNYPDRKWRIVCGDEDETYPSRDAAARAEYALAQAQPACDNDAGLFCPECGASDQLDIAATVQVRLTADGTDADEADDGSHTWDDDSPCSCAACGWSGTVMNADPEKTAALEATKEAAAAANIAKLPPKAFVTNTVGASGPRGIPPILEITRGEPGFRPVYTTEFTADELNEAEVVMNETAGIPNASISKAAASAMYYGSLFGWDAPAADPDNPINQKDD